MYKQYVGCIPCTVFPLKNHEKSFHSAPYCCSRRLPSCIHCLYKVSQILVVHLFLQSVLQHLCDVDIDMKDPKNPEIPASCSLACIHHVMYWLVTWWGGAATTETKSIPDPAIDCIEYRTYVVVQLLCIMGWALSGHAGSIPDADQCQSIKIKFQELI